MTARPADGHAGDLVSARIDGELDPETAAWVDDHLAACASCREIADVAAEARSWVKSAPTVDASPVVEGVINHRRRLVGTGLAFVGAAGVVLAALALTASVAHPTVVPDLDALVAAHQTSSHDRMDGAEAVANAGRPYVTPASMTSDLGNLTRRGVFDGPDLTAAVYGGTDQEVSVYQQPGRLDWDSLPEGSLADTGGRTVWLRAGTPVVAVTEVGDLVVTVVSDHQDAVRAVLEELPGTERSSTFERIHDSCQRLIEVFAVGG